MTSIGDNAFSGCTGLVSVTLPNTLTLIDAWTFNECTSLTDVSIPPSVTTIATSAFWGCTALTSLAVPDAVTTIETFAFYGCSALTDIAVGRSVSDIDMYAFQECSSLVSIDVDEDNATYTSVDGMLYTKDKKTLITAPAGLTSARIPDGVTTIGDYAFQGCAGLTSLTLPESVAEIGGNVLFECSRLESIYSLAVVPPAVYSFGLAQESYPRITLYVPRGTREAYQTADAWKDFPDIREFDTTGIAGPTADGATRPVAIYDPSGRRIDTPRRGLNLIRMNDGRTRKVYVK